MAVSFFELYYEEACDLQQFNPTDVKNSTQSQKHRKLCIK